MRDRSWQRSFLVICATTLCTPLARAETCGIDTIFFDGFENLAVLPALESAPGALQSPGASQSLVGPGTFSVAITYPANGATVSGSLTEVAGTFSGPTNTGIVVNGHIAYTDGTNFYASNVNLAVGGNTFTAVATKLTGESTSANSTITATAGAPPVSLTLSRLTGFAPFRARFVPMTGALPGGASVQSLAIDYDGDGNDDVTNPAVGADTSYLALQPGLYRARLTVHDSNNVTYVSYHHYLVQDFTRQSGMLCDVYGYMRQKLIGTPDIPGALIAIHPTERDKFQTLFNGFGSQLSPFASALGVIANGSLDSTFGHFLVVRKNSDQTLSGFRIEFSQDDLGVWRLSDM